MRKIGIIGLGLIGGSLCKSLKNKHENIEIIAYNKDEKPLKKALMDKVIDISKLEIDEDFSECEIIFICTPVDTIYYFAERLSKIINEETIVTDVGSTKNKIFNEVKKLNINFIGGHPMAGSEKTGYEASTDFLFENAYYILTPTEKTQKESYLKLEGLVRKIGAIPINLESPKHDYVVGAVSHMPHVVASALVNLIKDIDTDEIMHTLAAGGFKDITRIASSSPHVWNSICVDNKEEIIKLLDVFKNHIEDFKKLLSNNGNVYDFFDEAKNYRDSFASSKKGKYNNIYEIKVDVVDKLGSIATVATMLSVNQINIKNIGIINNREFENGLMSVIFDSEYDKISAKKLLEEMNYSVYI